MAAAATVKASTAATGESLSVIALISGGKDSFYSILHCQANGHRVVALANLYPSGTTGTGAAGGRRHAQSQSYLPPPSVSSRQGGHSEHSEVSVPRHEDPSSQLETGDTDAGDNDGETDLNSFMYQTVGHQIIPLYAQATGLPLHRQPIVGTAVHHGLSYANPRRGLVASSSPKLEPSDGQHSPATHDLQGYTHRQSDHEKELEPDLELEQEDETESLVPLLRTVLVAHPEANALCTGAILSTYQRTRVESVALRMGLVPLSYLWQFTELPAPVPDGGCDQGIGLVESITKSSHDIRRRARRKGQGPVRDDARLLRDMATAGLEARVVKVASAGLDEGFLWENVASEAGVQRVERAMRRFGAASGRGSILGEGGEFETLVIDGPPSLFKGRIVVSDGDRRVIREGGGCAWLSFRRADVVLKDELEQASKLQTSTLAIQIPGLLDPRFEDTIQCLLVITAGDKKQPGSVNPSSSNDNTNPRASLGPITNNETDLPKGKLSLSPQSSSSQEWRYLGSDGARSLTVKEQTVSIVDQIRRHLKDRALPATAITNSVIVLRHMSDFPLVNEHYGSLFDEPNPPSRVTIACGGELLPKDAAIAVYLSVQLRLQPHERRGLHVQSRSYWAPANIGPYSQAIAFPLLPLPTAEATAGEDGEDVDEPQQQSDMSSSPLAVSIAGQIPLLPASMALPLPSTPNHVELQITLALQHLWRVGIEMQVRWWTSAVAYFPATSSTETMKHQALLAATAWKAAHLWPDLGNGKESDDNSVSDDDDGGPDIWDRRYNSQFMTYGGGDEESFPLSLPNWSVLEGLDVDGDDAEVLLKIKPGKIPFFFAAEVEELPRQAGVEWHAHLGLAELQPGSVTVYSTIYDQSSSPGISLFQLELHHAVVDSGNAIFVQTTAALRSPGNNNENQRTSVRADSLYSVFAVTATSLEKLFSLSSNLSIKPKITYTEALQLADDSELREIGALIPCYSLWDSQGRRLSAVCIFETRLTKMK